METPALTLGSNAVKLDDRYRDFEPIGRGAHADVYVATDSWLGRNVAVKVLRMDASGPAQQPSRFLREAMLTAQISHVGVPTIFDVGLSECGRLYLTTELLSGGETLLTVLSGLRRGAAGYVDRYPLDALVQILIEVCDALAAAHRRGIVHRDLKPEHILISRDHTIRLIDWGIARKVAADDSKRYQGSFPETRRSALSLWARQSGDARLTLPGQKPGTPLYMSPEHILDPSAVDQRSDIYSFGAVLFDCLALTPMNQAGSINEVFHKIVHGEPSPPSQVSLRPEVPAALETIWRRCVAKAPVQRFRDAASLRDALREAAVELALDSGSPSAVHGASQSLDRNDHAFSKANVNPNVDLNASRHGSNHDDVGSRTGLCGAPVRQSAGHNFGVPAGS